MSFSGYLCPKCGSSKTIPKLGMVFKCIPCGHQFDGRKANTQPEPVAQDPASEVVREEITRVERNGSWARRVVAKYHVPERDPRDIPDLEVDEAKAEFFRWRFREQVKKDRRWGRDNLTGRGIVCVGKVLVNGQRLKLYVPKDEIEEFATLTDKDFSDAGMSRIED